MENSPCSNQDNCRLADSKRGCREDVHHKFYFKRDYAKGIAKVFRELDDNKILMCRAEHEEIHATQPRPEMPSLEVMYQAVNAQRLGRAEGAA